MIIFLMSVEKGYKGIKRKLKIMEKCKAQHAVLCPISLSTLVEIERSSTLVPRH